MSPSGRSGVNSKVKRFSERLGWSLCESQLLLSRKSEPPDAFAVKACIDSVQRVLAKVEALAADIGRSSRELENGT